MGVEELMVLILFLQPDLSIQCSGGVGLGREIMVYESCVLSHLGLFPLALPKSGSSRVQIETDKGGREGWLSG